MSSNCPPRCRRSWPCAWRLPWPGRAWPGEYPAWTATGVQEYDVTIIATSTLSPEQLQQTGRLVPDLAAKLRKRHVRIPSLGERGPDDVRLLCQDIVRRISLREGRQQAPQIDGEVISKLCQTAWPENLSDLVRVLEYAVRRSRGGMIRPAHLPKNLTPTPPRPRTLDAIVAEAQRTAIENALEQSGGKVAAAAKLLGKNKGNLYKLMAKLAMPVGRRK